MNRSEWDWATYFRLHEAACLIGGFPCVSLKNPTTEQLPAGARPILIKLATAYVCWYQLESGMTPTESSVPLLAGIRQSDGSLPPLSEDAKDLSGEFVSRQSLIDFLHSIGKTSVYEFDLSATKTYTNAASGRRNTVEDPGHGNPWEIPDPRDPKAVLPWYTAARYFARQLIKEDTTLLSKREILADKVSRQLAAVGIFKRGGKKPFNGGTIKKALVNIYLD